ncbi:bifunctional aminoglycoside phosphotransferase/ATP-binding protein [Acidisphaera rubrifaciens]|uniref:bifunctional aminoglycoside phosphotransferase/ATP-binding protein n=1 Tax=Acidisphaera rubrifaciens TaxID=50715 RepID=UPI0006620E09|nr:AAA family ATPase [Acidisphaera rubrifaciens]
MLKLRKAISRPVADSRSRRWRRVQADYELAVSAPLAPGLHHDLLAIVRRSDGGLALASEPLSPDTPAVDWALRMTRVETTDFARACVDADALEGRAADLLADRVFTLHHHPATPPQTGGGSETGRILALTTVKAALDAGFAQADVQAWAGTALMRLDDVGRLLDERTAAGAPVARHGNLHLGNICRWQHEWTPVDAIPPDPPTGVPDAVWDVASLLIELHAAGLDGPANRLFSRYVARTGDAGLVALLPLFMGIRGLLRAADLATADPTDASRRAQFSAECLDRGQSVVVAVGGVPGVGKTTLGRRLAVDLGPFPGALLMRWDDVRKRLLGLVPEAPSDGAGHDLPAVTRTRDALVGQVRAAALAGRSVVVEALFLDPTDRAAVARAAAEAGAAFTGLWLDAPLPLITERLEGRAYDASESTVESLRTANQIDPGVFDWQRLDTTDADAALAAAQAALAAYRRRPARRARAPGAV